MAEQYPFREYRIPNQKKLGLAQIAARYDALKGAYSSDELSRERFRLNYGLADIDGPTLLIRHTRNERPKVVLTLEEEVLNLKFAVNTNLRAAVLSSVIVMPDGSVRIRPTSEEIQTARLRDATKEDAQIIVNVCDIAMTLGATIHQLLEAGILSPQPAGEDDIFDFSALNQIEIPDMTQRYPNPEPEEVVAVTIFRSMVIIPQSN